jgi:quercetin dioxygenase-like cupin family protein
MPEAPRIARIEDIPALSSAGVGYRLVRRALGVRAFGVNGFTADSGELLIEPHDELSPNAARHEELYVIVSGHARFTIDGGEHDAPAGTLVFVPDPASRREASAVADGTTALVVGGRPGEPYEVSPWESGLAAQMLFESGDADGAADLMEAAVADYPGRVPVLYNAACFAALAGRREVAMTRLLEAVALDRESVLKWSAEDEDLDSLRDDPSFPA